MIWSVIRIAFFVALAGALAFGAAYVQDTPGEVRMAFGAQEISLTPLGFLVALLILFLAFWLLARLVGLLIATLRFLTGDETALSRYFDKSRERRGFNALADGMIALASGDGVRAKARAAKAERLLKRPELTQLLQAEAAEMTGDSAAAQQHYKALLGDQRTRFVGIRGLMKARLAVNDTTAALKLAEKAHALKPRDTAMQASLLGLQVDAAQWEGARKTLRAQLKSGALPRDVSLRRDAVLQVADAMAAHDAGDLSRARAAALAANRAAPGLVPAAILAAQVHEGDGNQRQAASILRKAWAQQPQPDLATAYAALAPDEGATARRKRFAPLLKLRPEHPETKMLDCELWLQAEDFPAARRALGALAQSQPSTRSLSLMAAIVQGEGGAAHEVRAWLARALTAPRGEMWVCDKCNHLHSQWLPVCENCKGFDTLAWAMPPATAQGDLPAAMMPLLAEDAQTAPATATDSTPPPPDIDLPDDAELLEIDPLRRN